MDEIQAWASRLIEVYGCCYHCGGPMETRMDWEPVDDKVVLYLELHCLNRRCPEPWPQKPE